MTSLHRPPSVLPDKRSCQSPLLRGRCPDGQRSGEEKIKTATKLLAFFAALLLLLQPAHAAPSHTAILAEKPPKLLSEFGFFSDMGKQTPAAGVVPFRLNTPLFSDNAQKFRFVHVPEGRAATYDETEVFEFPVGTALIKTFAFPADYRKPQEKLRLIETRVLLRHDDGWQAWAYLWNDAQTDAVLKIAGARVDIPTIVADGSALYGTQQEPVQGLSRP